MKLKGCASALGLFVAASANAETQYISDKLVVSVYAEANQESEKLTTLDSGDAVDALEKAEGYTRVKLSDGREGWIRSNYLSTQVPAIVRVKELEKERGSGGTSIPAAVSEELKSLKEHNAALRNEVEGLKQAAQTVSHNDSSAATSSKAAAPQTSSIVNNPIEASAGHAWKWGVPIGVGGILLGFAFGYRALAKKIERKYGKLKIY